MDNLISFALGLIHGFSIEYRFSKYLFKYYYHLGIVHEKNEALERQIKRKEDFNRN